MCWDKEEDSSPQGEGFLFLHQPHPDDGSRAFCVHVRSEVRSADMCEEKLVFGVFEEA